VLVSLLGGIFPPIFLILSTHDEMIGENQSGTAAWPLSKPVLRVAAIVAKLLTGPVPQSWLPWICRVAWIALFCRVGDPAVQQARLLGLLSIGTAEPAVPGRAAAQPAAGIRHARAHGSHEMRNRQ